MQESSENGTGGLWERALALGALAASSLLALLACILFYVLIRSTLSSGRTNHKRQGAKRQGPFQILSHLLFLNLSVFSQSGRIARLGEQITSAKTPSAKALSKSSPNSASPNLSVFLITSLVSVCLSVCLCLLLFFV